MVPKVFNQKNNWKKQMSTNTPVDDPLIEKLRALPASSLLPIFDFILCDHILLLSGVFSNKNPIFAHLHYVELVYFFSTYLLRDSTSLHSSLCTWRIVPSDPHLDHPLGGPTWRPREIRAEFDPEGSQSCDVCSLALRGNPLEWLPVADKGVHHIW